MTGKNRNYRWALVLGVLVMSGVSMSCSTTDTNEEPATPASQDVSAIPWNRPESWEGQGMMPGFMGYSGTR